MGTFDQFGLDVVEIHEFEVQEDKLRKYNFTLKTCSQPLFRFLGISGLIAKVDCGNKSAQQLCNALSK